MLKNPKVWLGHCAEFTDRDQIAVELEIERQMEDDYDRQQMVVEFSSYLERSSRCPWRLFVTNEGYKLSLNVIIPGYTPKEKVESMVRSGRFDRLVPDWVEDWDWWVEKW